MKSGHADLPLHYGKVPRWLAARMSSLGGAIAESIVIKYGKSSPILSFIFRNKFRIIQSGLLSKRNVESFRVLEIPSHSIIIFRHARLIQDFLPLLQNFTRCRDIKSVTFSKIS